MPEKTRPPCEATIGGPSASIPEAQSVADALSDALGLHRKGALEQASAGYEAILANWPDNADALHLLGVISNQTGSYARAVDLIEKALRIAPAQGLFYANRGNALQNLGRLPDAIVSYDAAIALKPDHAAAHFGRGNALLAQGQFECAVASFDQAIALSNNHAAAHNNRGTALHRLKRYEAAVASYDNAILLKPDYAEAHFSRGIALSDCGMFEAALASHDRAIALRPEYADAHFGRGNALLALRRIDAALSTYGRTIALRPTSEAHNNAGLAHMALHQFGAAVASFDEAIALAPGNPMPWYNRGNACLELRRPDAAADSYDRAQALGLDQAFLRCVSLHARMHACDWREFDRRLDDLKTDIESGTASLPPFPLLGLIDAPRLQLRAAATWAAVKHPHGTPPSFQPRAANARKIRLGYYSADFHEHATSKLIANLFESHDREVFELFAFSFGPDTADPMQRRVAKAFDRFIDVRSSRDREIAALSRQLGIDIAIDLKGYTTDARPGIFAERCAPVQVSYLGYPGTLGAPFIDYLIADRQIVPDGRRRDYSEKLAYLPICYQPNDPSRRIAETTDARSDHALPAHGFVFCCFNASYKILPDMFDVWMRILGAVEGSVLWLLNENSTTMANLRGEAERRGVSGERLVFAPRIAGTAHLARHRHADLFLDTFPCNAHTTASDALWAGLPVLTRCGESFASRVAASLLNAVQLNELVTATGEDYARQAIELATHGDKLSTLKTRLAAQRDTAPLFDSTRYARDIESTYLAMIERRQAGLSPAHLYPGARSCNHPGDRR